MTARLLIDACGLSQREAAEFLSVRLDTVKSWYRRDPPAARPGVLDELRRLHAHQRRAAAETIRLVRGLSKTRGAPDGIDLYLSPDDRAAHERGWPCVGAHRQMLALAVARMPSETFQISSEPDLLGH